MLQSLRRPLSHIPASPQWSLTVRRLEESQLRRILEAADEAVAVCRSQRLREAYESERGAHEREWPSRRTQAVGTCLDGSRCVFVELEFS